MALSSNLTTFSNVTDGAPLSPDYLNGKFGVLDKNINEMNSSKSLTMTDTNFVDHFRPALDDTYDIGSATSSVGTVYASAINSLRTYTATTGLSDGELGLVGGGNSTLSLVARSDGTYYDIGSGTSAAVV